MLIFTGRAVDEGGWRSVRYGRAGLRGIRGAATDDDVGGAAIHAIGPIRRGQAASLVRTAARLRTDLTTEAASFGASAQRSVGGGARVASRKPRRRAGR